LLSPCPSVLRELNIKVATPPFHAKTRIELKPPIPPLTLPPKHTQPAMATRRIISEKSLLEKDDRIGSSPAAGEKSNISPAVPAYALTVPLYSNATR